MEIRTSPAMLKAIDNHENSNPNYFTNCKSMLQLGENKSYIIRVFNGEVSVIRNSPKLSVAGRVKNAVIDFFKRSVTKGESGFTCRASQIQAELQQRITKHRLEMKQVFTEQIQIKDMPAPNGAIEKDKNAAHHINPETSKTGSADNKVSASEGGSNHYMVDDAIYATINTATKRSHLTENYIVSNAEKTPDKEYYLALLEFYMRARPETFQVLTT